MAEEGAAAGPRKVAMALVGPWVDLVMHTYTYLLLNNIKGNYSKVHRIPKFYYIPTKDYYRGYSILTKTRDEF